MEEVKPTLKPRKLFDQKKSPSPKKCTTCGSPSKKRKAFGEPLPLCGENICKTVPRDLFNAKPEYALRVIFTGERQLRWVSPKRHAGDESPPPPPHLRDEYTGRSFKINDYVD